MRNQEAREGLARIMATMDVKRHKFAAIATSNGGQNGFRQKRKRREIPDPSQNLHVEKGAPVTLGEVRAHALDGHPACRARPGLGKDGRPCSCATKRYFRAHPEIIVDAQGNAWHPASKKAP